MLVKRAPGEKQEHTKRRWDIKEYQLLEQKIPPSLILTLLCWNLLFEKIPYDLLRCIQVFQNQVTESLTCNLIVNSVSADDSAPPGSMTHYRDVTKSIKASHNTDNSSVCLAVCFGSFENNIKAHVNGPLRGESTGDRWISHTKGQ